MPLRRTAPTLPRTRAPLPPRGRRWLVAALAAAASAILALLLGWSVGG